ncbi:hypothetical protein [Sediminibacterium sp.]|uniref:hypothetical protein n=1 Tax=Sediminibacterium sp. TaxID=1917865 RepID=UPI0026011970|nr:hypothetical protein [Sediminibacterium sp.]MBW0177573.1 hypothetical protein [Sediminibacterium sp.]
MKKIVIIVVIILFVQDIQSQSVVYNWNGTVFGANGAQARRMTIGRVYYNQYHWGTYGNMKITIRSSYFKSGYVEYLLQANPATNGNVPLLFCLNAGGYNASFVKLELGEQTNAGNEYYGGVNYYRDIYLDADYYTVWYAEAEITGPYALDKYSIADSEYSFMTLFSSPGIANTASFGPHRKRIIIPASFADFQIDGKLGIGTSTEPAAALEVNGNIFTSSQINYLQFGTNSGNAPYVAGSTEGSLALGTANAAKLWVLPNGNVGIGTASPASKLSVNGDIRSKKIIVSQTGWPDYVFDASYKLTPLKQVGRFITKYKHLPNLPSAKEVEEKGINVGDQQALLLKKIEELTLYLIKQDQQIDILSKEIQDLKEENRKTKSIVKKTSSNK